MNILKTLSGAMGSALSQAKQAYQNFQTDLPTNVATAQRYVRQAIAPKYSIPGFDQVRQNNEYGEEAYNQQTPMERINYNFANEGIYMDPGAIKNGSAELQPMGMYPNDPRLSALKQASLNAMNLRPAMRRYLETIPIQQGNLRDIIVNPDGTLSSAGGMAPGGGQGFQTTNPGGNWETNTNMTLDPSIILANSGGDPNAMVDPNSMKTGFMTKVLRHEYLHQTPRTQQVKIGMEKLLQAMPQNSPLRDAALQYLSNGELPPNPEELFATLGEQYGQYVLMMPEIQAYYRNIFMQPTTQMRPPQIMQKGVASEQFLPGNQTIPIRNQ